MRRGVILAGGRGTRLYPLTEVVSKQLLPVYDKPLLYYPLTTLMLAGVREFLVITTPQSVSAFMKLLGTGEQFGISIEYEIQTEPRGIADALILAEGFLGGHDSALILGDNIFHGPGLGRSLAGIKTGQGAVVTALQSASPEEFGVVEFDANQRVLSIEEKPKLPRSDWIVPGLYFYDSTASERSKSLQPSERGELEITDLNLSYLIDSQLRVLQVGRGCSWFDAGTVDSLLDSSEYVRTIQARQGTLVGSPEEAAWRNGWMTADDTLKEIERSKPSYGRLLEKLMERA